MEELVIHRRRSSVEESASDVQAAPLTTERTEIDEPDANAVHANASIIIADVLPTIVDDTNELLEEGASGSQSSAPLNDDTTENEAQATSTSKDCSKDIDKTTSTEVETVPPSTDQMEVDVTRAVGSTSPVILSTAVHDETHSETEPESAELKSTAKQGNN